MADKPMYYGGTPIYYGGSGGVQYGSYGSYGSSSSGGAWSGAGAGSPSGNGGAGGDEGSLVGTITVGRMLRVISHRWLSVFVFLLIGLVASFAVYRISPTVYEASSDFTMDMRRSSGGHATGAVAELTPDYGSSYAEIFNTRIPEWRSPKIYTEIIQRYRKSFPASKVSDAELNAAASGSNLELQRNSRIIRITVESESPDLAAAVANAYADALEAFTDEENKQRCDKAVARIHESVESQQRVLDRISNQKTDYRTANKVDILIATRDQAQRELDKVSSDILEFEGRERLLVEWEKVLQALQKNPETFRDAPKGVPGAEQIASEYKVFQEASGLYKSMLVAYTENHPDVVMKKAALETARQRFLESVGGALMGCQSDLQLVRNQVMKLRELQQQKNLQYASFSQQVVLAESGMAQLEKSYESASDMLKELALSENQARLEAEANNETVHIQRRATVPSVPVRPNPTMIFGAGAALSLALGLLFVLIVDNLEDTIVSLADLEGRLALKVLAVLPHIRRKKREQVAKFAVEDKYSQFSESVAGLRNLLDSPRYEALSRCMLVISTQPGEGKTITSCSIAIAYAQAGKKTLIVDFDLRRPRQAGVWDLKLTAETSFSHTLQAATEGQKPDFAKLVQPSGVAGLSVVASLPPDGVSPSTIFGSSVVAEFFEWARANFDRIIVDSPPYGVVGDVVSLAVLVDSSLIMCCPDRTHFKPIQYCSRCLTEAGANILGVIVNDVEINNAAAFSPMNHHHYGRYGYGSGYGYGYGYRPKSSQKAIGTERTSKGDFEADERGESEEAQEEFSDEE